MTQNRRRKAATVTVYNSTDGPLPYDDEGHVIPARESLEVPAEVTRRTGEGDAAKDEQRPSVDVDPIKGHVDSGRFVITSDLETDDASGNADADASTQPEE